MTPRSTEAALTASAPGVEGAFDLGRQLFALDDLFRELVELAPGAPGGVAQDLESFLDGKAKPPGDQPLRLLDHDARLERGLELDHALEQEHGRVLGRASDGCSSV